MIRIALLAALALACVALPAQARTHHHRHHHARHVPLPVPRPAAADMVVSHPTGCPRSAFCGCGAAVRVFGRPVRDLWLASNWFRFPRATPGPGMVAVRRHHVMVLEADLGGGLWSVFDANSGRGMTRIHARSLAGFVVVDPHGGG